IYLEQSGDSRLYKSFGTRGRASAHYGQWHSARLDRHGHAALVDGTRAGGRCGKLDSARTSRTDVGHRSHGAILNIGTGRIDYRHYDRRQTRIARSIAPEEISI